MLFATNTSQREDPSVLVRKPLINFTKALELLRLHADKGFVITLGDASIGNITLQIDLASQQLIDSNRVKLQSIVEMKMKVLQCYIHTLK